MKKGFTLIEVIVSIALIAILITVIGAVNISMLRINFYSRERDRSFNIARGVCEIFKSENTSFDGNYYTGVYKYIDGLSDVSSIREVFDTRDGDYSGDDSVTNASNKKYTLILNLSGNPTSQSGVLMPQLRILKVTVIKNGTIKSTVTLTEAR